jgi:hypothetical protein
VKLPKLAIALAAVVLADSAARSGDSAAGQAVSGLLSAGLAGRAAVFLLGLAVLGALSFLLVGRRAPRALDLRHAPRGPGPDLAQHRRHPQPAREDRAPGAAALRRRGAGAGGGGELALREPGTLRGLSARSSAG